MHKSIASLTLNTYAVVLMIIRLIWDALRHKHTEEISANAENALRMCRAGLLLSSRVTLRGFVCLWHEISSVRGQRSLYVGFILLALKWLNDRL